MDIMNFVGCQSTVVLYTTPHCLQQLHLLSILLHASSSIDALKYVGNIWRKTTNIQSSSSGFYVTVC